MSYIRCDKPMRQSKERAGKNNKNKWIDDVHSFRCKGNCTECICGMVKRSDGTWEHVKPER